MAPALHATRTSRLGRNNDAEDGFAGVYGLARHLQQFADYTPDGAADFVGLQLKDQLLALRSENGDTRPGKDFLFEVALGL